MLLHMCLSLLLFLGESTPECTNPGAINNTQVLLSLAHEFGIKAWNETTDATQWPGVDWSSHNQVDGITLSSVGLSGVFPSIWDRLPSLDRLDLSHNNISLLNVAGCMNTKLRLLNLSSNHLRQPPKNLPSLTSLEILDLSYNFLVGAPRLPKLRSLLSLNLSSNQLARGFSIGDNLGLEYLMLSSNRFKGSVPEYVGLLTNLTHLDMSWNNLTGVIPDIWNNTLSLERLDLSHNILEGGLPPSLLQRGSLLLLNAGYNRLSGPLKLEQGDLESVEFLILWFNQFNGTIPVELGGVKNLRSLFLAENSFTGPIPLELANCSKLERVRIL